MQSDRDVLQALFDEGPITRPELAALTGLSKPTVSGSIRRLRADGLLREIGSRRGQPGRAPSCYTVDPEAAFVIGIDVSGANLQVLIVDIVGTSLVEQQCGTLARGGEVVIRQAAELSWATVRQLGLDTTRLAVVAVSVPGVIDPESGHVSLAHRIGQSDTAGLLHPLAEWFDAPLLLENDVNCAALAERRLGHGRSVADFAFISVGAGVGMGMMCQDQLLRGGNGAASHLGHLPIADDPFNPDHRARGALESEAGAVGLLARAASRPDWPGFAPTTVEELFDLAVQGIGPAITVLNRETELIGMAVASVCTVVDPQLVVLGGGIGSNPLLLAGVRRSAAALLPAPPRVETSQVGVSASLHGAATLALRKARLGLLQRAQAASAERIQGEAG